nr:DUF3783 domain-containing protein [Parablautia muri]
MVFVELGEDKLESVLSLLHSNPACGKIPYKAVLTQTNQNWNGIDLLEELRKEHAAMELARGTV